MESTNNIDINFVFIIIQLYRKIKEMKINQEKNVDKQKPSRL